MGKSIYISYSQKDKELVDIIKTEIESLTGSIVLMLEKNIEGLPEQYVLDTINSICKCDYFLFILTEHSQMSETALLELSFAKKKATNGMTNIFIVKTDNCIVNDSFMFRWGNRIYEWNGSDKMQVVNQILGDSYNNNSSLDKLHIIVRDGKKGFVDHKGDIVIPCKWTDVDDFYEGLAAVEDAETGLLGYINKGGKYVIAPQFEDACGFSEGLARVFDFSSDRWGFVDKSGDFVIKPQFKSALDFSEGLVAVKFEDEHFGFINKNGSTVIKLPYLLPDIYCINNFHNGLAKINDKISGSIVYINKAGEVVYLHNYK